MVRGLAWGWVEVGSAGGGVMVRLKKALAGWNRCSAEQSARRRK